MTFENVTVEIGSLQKWNVAPVCITFTLYLLSSVHPTVDSEAPQLCCGIEPLYISEISKTMAKNMSTPNTSELSHLISNRTTKVADVFFPPNVYFRDSTLT